MPTLDNSVFAGEVLRHGAVPREEIGSDGEGLMSPTIPPGRDSRPLCHPSGLCRLTKIDA